MRVTDPWATDKCNFGTNIHAFNGVSGICVPGSVRILVLHHRTAAVVQSVQRRYPLIWKATKQ